MTYDEYKKHLEACGPLDDISKGLLSAFELGYGQGIKDGKTHFTKALAEPEQEPVAWSVLNKRTGKHWYTHESRYTAQYYANEYSHRESDNTPSMVVTPLYTAPPKREWVGLTDDEIEDEWQFLMATYIEEVDSSYWGRCDFEFARAIEAKLKEKNT